MTTKRSICTYAMIPVRAEASECSEMVTQIIFGEAYDVLEVQDRWARICTVADNYPGWIDSKLITEVSDADVAQWSGDDLYVTYLPFNKIESMEEGNLFPAYAPMGSVIFNGKSMPTILGREDKLCTLGGHKFILHGESEASAEGRPQSPVECAKRMLGAPYLWGGRTAFGIDCSGLVQLSYKVCGIQLPRDASQMINLGTEVPYGQQTDGDLAFFVNPKGRICHVGLCMADGRIIHSSGCVRIDRLDEEGVYNAERGKYTHKLLCIKRP